MREVMQRHPVFGFSVSALVLFAAACGGKQVQQAEAPAAEAPLAEAEDAGSCLMPALPMAKVTASSDGSFPSAACVDLGRAVVARLTLREKLGQMVQAERRDLGNGQDVQDLSLGSVLSGGGSSPAPNLPIEWAKMVNGFRQRSLDSSSHLPLLYGIDAVHGHNNVKDAVLFPHNIGLGAARDADLVRRIGAATAQAVAGTNIDWTFAPVIAVARDERWGRTYESFGESPELAELLGPAMIQGLQGERLGRQPNSVLACAKHFVGDGNTAGGKDQGDALLTMEQIRTQLLPAYKKSIEAGVGSVMVSFSSVEGVKMHCHGPLLNDVLKTELGFGGLLVSDWEAVELLPGDYATQLSSAINAGLDMVMKPKSTRQFLSTMEELVPSRIPLERVDEAATRIITVKCELGMLKETAYAPDRSGQLPISDAISTISSQEHRELAREAVRKSLVLLKNENQRLPLAKTAKRIVVAGRNANDIGNQSGGWSIEWQGQGGPITRGTTIFEGLKAAASGTEVVFSEDGSGAAGADVGIVVLGERPYAEGKGDDQDLELDAKEVAAAQAIANAKVPLVVVLVSGRPMLLDPVLPLAEAIVAAWLPGTEGQGIADVLFGDFDFVGTLPHSWPRSLSQIPINVGDANYDPLFPYGFGLRYKPAQ
jgi:beta-glucosidase